MADWNDDPGFPDPGGRMAAYAETMRKLKTTEAELARVKAENAALRDAAKNLALVLESTTEQSAIGNALAGLRKALAGTS